MFRSETKNELTDSNPSTTPLKTLIAVNLLGGMVFGYNTGTQYRNPHVFALCNDWF